MNAPAISLEQMLEKPLPRAVKVTVLGEPGTGKTTLACTFPEPVLLRFEDGTQSLGDAAPMSTPVIRSNADAMFFLKQLLEQEHEFKTLVVDSVTAYATNIVEPEVLAADPRGAKNLAQAHGGYGAGFQQCAEMIRQFCDACCRLQDERGMHIVYIAHASSEVIEQPDMDPYQRLTLRCNKRYTPHFVDDVDVVGLLRLKANMYGTGERKKLRTDGTRILQVQPSPASVTKNRYGIDADIEVGLGENPLAQIIPSLSL